MSDVSQGPGWWQASDGKWYAPKVAPGVTAPPPPAQKKKFYTRVWFWLLVVVVVLFGGCSAVVFGTATAVNTAADKLSTGGFDEGPAPSDNPGCTKAPPSYPDQQKTHDCVALPDGSASVSGTTVTTTGWARSQDSIGYSRICTDASIKNSSSSTVSYSEYDFKLQSPSGTVNDADIILDDSLGTGDLVAGGTASGKVCFEDPGQTGTYVSIYKPSAFVANRGIWLVQL